jgi:hypothetical protein
MSDIVCSALLWVYLERLASDLALRFTLGSGLCGPITLTWISLLCDIFTHLRPFDCHGCEALSGCIVGEDEI